LTDPTNAIRQARFRKARALGLEYVSGYLPPDRAGTVRGWITEALERKEPETGTQPVEHLENIGGPKGRNYQPNQDG
jgi:hypothetical protein